MRLTPNTGYPNDVAALLRYWLLSLNPVSPPQWSGRVISRRLVCISLFTATALLFLANALNLSFKTEHFEDAILMILIYVLDAFLIPFFVGLGIRLRTPQDLNYWPIFSHYALMLPVLGMVDVLFVLIRNTTHFAVIVGLLALLIQFLWSLLISLNSLAQGANRKRRDVILWLLLAYFVVLIIDGIIVIPFAQTKIL